MVVADVFENRNVVVCRGCVCGAFVEKSGIESDGRIMEDKSTGDVTSEIKLDLVCDITGSLIAEVIGLTVILLDGVSWSLHSSTVIMYLLAIV